MSAKIAIEITSKALKLSHNQVSSRLSCKNFLIICLLIISLERGGLVPYFRSGVIFMYSLQ